jgi:hypothetical protein
MNFLLVPVAYLRGVMYKISEVFKNKCCKKNSRH